MFRNIDPCFRRLICWCAAVMGTGLLLLVPAWIFCQPLLRGVAHAWIVDEPPGHADAIVILGGGEQYRIAKAAELFHAGAAPLILIPKQKLRPTDRLNITKESHNICLEMLAMKGVPPSAIQIMDSTVHNTHEEAVAVRGWAQLDHAKRIVIPTDIWHTRRARWIFHRILGGGTEVAVVAISPDDYTPDNWWQNEQGLIFFEVEVSKMAYYWFKY